MNLQTNMSPQPQNKSPQPQLCILAALNCEAKALIDRFKLKKTGDQPFSLFAGDSTLNGVNTRINVVISGIGMLNMSCAIGWLAAQSLSTNSVWINVGTAGHAELAVGDGFIVSSTQDVFSSKAYFTPQVAPRPVSMNPCMTLNAPSNDYPEVGGIDMEAAAFFNAATRFTAAECVQSYKVVSDTPEQGIERLSAKVIAELLQPHTDHIVSYSESLLSVLNEQKKVMAKITMPALKATHSQQQQFLDLSRKLSALNSNQELTLLQQQVNGHHQINALLDFLHQQLASIELDLAKLDLVELDVNANNFQANGSGA